MAGSGGGEALDPTRPGDIKEAFNIGLDLPPDDPDLIAGASAFPRPQRLAASPGVAGTALEYFDAVCRLGVLLHRPIALDLGLPPGWFADKLDRPLATLRLLRYPPARGGARLSPETGAIGAGSTRITAISPVALPMTLAAWKCAPGTGAGSRRPPFLGPISSISAIA